MGFGDSAYLYSAVESLLEVVHTHTHTRRAFTEREREREIGIESERERAINRGFLASGKRGANGNKTCRRLKATVDGRNPAPPKKPWNDESNVNTNKQWFPMIS